MISKRLKPHLNKNLQSQNLHFQDYALRYDQMLRVSHNWRFCLLVLMKITWAKFRLIYGDEIFKSNFNCPLSKKK